MDSSSFQEISTMQRLLDTFSELDTSQKILYVVGSVTAVAVSTVVIKKLLAKQKKTPPPRDTVVVHQVGRGPYAPSLSPYVVKLETYLRIANIPYQVEHSMTPGPKGKWPWMEYNDVTVADSEFCIDFLRKKFNVEMNSRLTTFDRGVAQAVRVMVDEHMAWCLGMFRYIYDPEVTLVKKGLKLNRLMIWLFRRKVRKFLHYQGTGRHSKEEVTLLLERDLQGIADILGQKKYLMGDKPCEADCAVFGQLSQLYWHCVGNDAEHIVRDQFPTLAAYCERIKTNYWPDWDECTTRGFTTVATR